MLLRLSTIFVASTLSLIPKPSSAWQYLPKTTVFRWDLIASRTETCGSLTCGCSVIPLTNHAVLSVSYITVASSSGSDVCTLSLFAIPDVPGSSFLYSTYLEAWRRHPRVVGLVIDFYDTRYIKWYMGLAPDYNDISDWSNEMKENLVTKPLPNHQTSITSQWWIMLPRIIVAWWWN